MKAKEYLRQLQTYNNIINSKCEEVRRWKEIATSISFQSEGERVQSSGVKDKISKAVSIYVDLEEELINQIYELEAKRQAILLKIENILDGDEYAIVYQHYVCAEEYQDIADNMERSYRWVTSINGHALAKIQKELDKCQATEQRATE